MNSQGFSYTSDEAADNLRKALGATTPRAQQSLLIEAHAARAQQVSPFDAYRQYKRNSFTQPSNLDQRVVLEFDAFAAEMIPADMRLIELSPVTAFALNTALAGISQKTVLSTIRNTEVVADAVVVLALEAARERRESPAGWRGTSLGTFHRELRTQVHEQPGFTPHFRALSLVDARNVDENLRFKAEVFSRHVGIYLNIISGARRLGYRIGNVSLALSSMRIMELIIRKQGLDRELIRRYTQKPGFSVFEHFGIPIPATIPVEDLPDFIGALPADYAYLKRPLIFMRNSFEETLRTTLEYRAISGFPGFDVVFDLDRHAGIGYYEDVCVKISANNDLGESYSLVDIGTNDWLSRITNNRSDRLLTGGMGTEIFIANFSRHAR